MIKNLKKVLIYGIKQQVDIFFKSAQENGFIEFIGSSKKLKRISEPLKEYISAIKVLKKQPKQVQIEEKIAPHLLIKNILHLNQSLEKLFEEKRLVSSEIIRIAPFGHFSKEDMLNLEKEIHRYFQFFTLKKSNKEKLKIPEELIYINSAYDLDYFIAINQARKSYPKMIETFIDLPLDVLIEKKDVIEKQIQKIQKELKHLASYLNYLSKEMINELNVFNLQSAEADAMYPIDASFFAIQAWVAENKFEKLKQITKSLNVAFVEIAIEKNDRVPTCLENKDSARIGEDLITIYDIPSITDKDPSMWVLIFFSIFFGVIVSDAGYGLLYLLIGLFMKFKFKNPKYFLKRFIKLIMILSTSCIIWGTLIGSFFGLGLELDSPKYKYSVLNQIIDKKAAYHMQQKDDVYEEWTVKYPKAKSTKNPQDFLRAAYNDKEPGEEKYEAYDEFKNNVLMEFALLIGVVHIILSFIRYIKRNLSGIGWIIFLIGGYMYFPSLMNATSFLNFFNILDKQVATHIGKILFFSGISFSVVTALIQKRVHGAEEITKSISIFADILSYLRLYALGLAGAITSMTVNNFAASAGIFFGFFLVVFGHAINVLLSIMGGVIHGLRLNFIEWYHYSFEGDGKAFNPLKLIK
ncbi:MAG: V-type ATPase 116kDa subunit family protein [Parachlamydiales bacterium]|jgi:V/A-type H+-transporting ATPase subunit I